MNAWINIDASPDDQEILAVNRLESSLENIPKQVHKVRELITRFEVCHFKYRRHYDYIIKSIAALQPLAEVDRIGSSHPHHSADAWKHDTTGRSRTGQMYISALRLWLEEDSFDNMGLPGQETLELRRRIDGWVGGKNEQKSRLIHMLISRLLWQSVEQYRSGRQLSELEYQIEATDICSYAFPQNLDRLIQAIGRLEPLRAFSGCGTFSPEIAAFLTKQFKRLCMWLSEEAPSVDIGLGRREPMKIWLVACLAKTIKTDIHLTDPLPAC